MRWTETDLASYRNRGLKAMHAAPSSQKKPKYRNVKTTDRQGRVHDSGKECRYYLDLELRERAGEIRNLRRQVPLACVVNGVHVCDYIADAMFEEGAAVVVIDVKSSATRKLPAYRLKVKLVQALHKLQIREVLS